MQRRTLLKLGLGATAVLAVAGYGAAVWSPGLTAAGHLSPASQQIFRGVALAVLEGNLPEAQGEADVQLAAHLSRVDAAVAGLAPATRKELSDLLALLATSPGRLGLTGLVPAWGQATTREVQAALQTMQRSSLQTRNQVYLALRELTVAAYFSDPATWSQLGYPGPTTI